MDVDSPNEEVQLSGVPLVSQQPQGDRLGRSRLPDVFETSGLAYEDRFSAYYDRILEYRRPCDVVGAFREYIEEEIEPVGWQAIWRSEKVDCDVLVEIMDVRANGFKADVRIMEPFQSNPETVTEEGVTTYLNEVNHLVPLAEIFPVYDESGDFDKTALAIEHLRFFFEHIWRGWDEDDEDDYIYVERHLEPRLKLYYDISDGTLATETVRKYSATLAVYKEKYEELTVMRKQVEGSDSEVDLDETCMIELTQKYQQLKVLQQSLEMMENPMMRLMISHHDSFSGTLPGEAKGPRLDGTVITHIVAKRLTVSMLQNLPPETVIKEYESPQPALSNCHDGDTVLVYPGTYPADGFYDLQDSITIRGVGNCDEIIIDCGQGGDISVDCHATCLNLANLTFVQHGTAEGVICVRHGTTTVDGCKFQCDAKGVVVRCGAELVVRDCEIYGAQSAGVTIHEGSTAVVSNTDIHHCGNMDDGTAQGGILIKAEETDEETVAKVKLSGNRIHDNFGYGISVRRHSAPMDGISSMEISGKDLEITKGINLEHFDNMFAGNSFGFLGPI
ncbi:SHC SH2 domain-binding protein 1 homolog B-like [Ptychodera flava]|uniref:SHC SH2 domain-binding protein 1 homolog B-like n=1 Tax=Ptychodera flava TaxID=63121 RepID=UPI00396A58FA